MENYPMNLEQLAERLKNLNLTCAMILDPQKYAEALETIRILEEMIKEEDPDAEITVDFDPLFGKDLEMEIVTSSFAIRNVKLFCGIAKNADVIGIEPRLDEKLLIGISFYNVKRTVG